MSVSKETPEVPDEKAAPPTITPTPPGVIVVPRWVILVTFLLGWGSGGALMAFELTGQARLSVFILAAWLIALPLVASNPFAALREILAGVLGTRTK